MSTPLSTDVEELEVAVSLKGKDVEKVRTVGKLLSPMIDDASHIYERLYQLKEGATVTIIFKLTDSQDKIKGEEVRREMEGVVTGKEVVKDNSEGEEVRTEEVVIQEEVGTEKDREGEEVRTEEAVICEEVGTEQDHVITVLCKHEHPFLNTKVWMQTKQAMDSTFLKGKIFLLVVLLPQKVYSQLNACFCSIYAVISVDGKLASKRLKIESKGTKMSTLEGMLGAFLITKDSIDKGGGGKQKQSGKARKYENNVSSGYAMFALAKNDWVPCISCGYPMLRGFAPEKHHRFDRMVTCSLGCFYNHAHYKDTDQDVLKNRTVKEVTDTLQAACADMIKAVRHANGEEVAGGISINLAEELRNNQKHLSDSLMTMQMYSWNSAAVVGPKCNRKLRGVSPVPVLMGQVTPALMQSAKTTRKYSTAMMNSNLKFDVSQNVNWEECGKAFLSAQGVGGGVPSFSSTDPIPMDVCDKMANAAVGPNEKERYILTLQSEITALKKQASIKEAEIATKN